MCAVLHWGASRPVALREQLRDYRERFIRLAALASDRRGAACALCHIRKSFCERACRICSGFLPWIFFSTVCHELSRRPGQESAIGTSRLV